MSITGNEFASSTPPKQGAWITAEKTKNLRTSGNKHTADVPEMTKPASASTLKKTTPITYVAIP